MSRRLFILVLAACVAAFGLGLLWLFQLRFARGDVYPPYSSLRADPLGTLALHDSLARLPGVTVRRDYSVTGRLPEPKGATYLHLAADPFDWEVMPREVVDEIEQFLRQGGRLVVAFAPDWRGSQPVTRTVTVPPAVVPGNTNVPVTITVSNSTPRLRRTWKEIQRNQDDREYVNTEDRWGYQLGAETIALDEDGNIVAFPVALRSPLGLPPELAWHSANHLKPTDDRWRIIYARGTNAVLMEKGMGAGTLVFSTDCYFASNESLAREPHADLLAWLVDPGSTIWFDEAHLGVTENPGVTTLMWRYGMHGFVGGIIVLLGLFVWKNAASFIPMRMPTRAAQNEIAGKEAGEGFVNLLRRHVKPSEILTVCFDEWTRSLRHRANYTVSGVDRAQAVMEQEIARPVRTRNPVQAYNEIARALKSSGFRVRSSEKCPEQPNPPNERKSNDHSSV
jgi:hypothetical protein